MTTHFYPAPQYRLPKLRLYALAAIFVACIGWFTYSLFCEKSISEGRLATCIFVLAITTYNVAELFWPVLSVQGGRLVLHRACWFSKRIQLRDIADIDESPETIYLTTKTGKQIPISLRKLADADRTLAGSTISKFLDRQQPIAGQ